MLIHSKQLEFSGQLNFAETSALVHIFNIINEAEESKVWTVVHKPFDLFRDWKLLKCYQ